MNDDVKQVIIVRKDLKMRKGKMIAQGAHASLAVLLRGGTIQNISVYPRKNNYVIPLTPEMEQWLEGRFTKICVGVDSEDELLTIYDKAKMAKLPCSLIQDAGLTEFDGVPTYTAVAIGPAKNNAIDKITGDLKLL